MANTRHDTVDRITGQWREQRPDLDVSPIEVIGRISRLSRLIDRRLEENFARFDIEAWMYDVLATLRRGGEPYELTAGDLVRQSMVTTGAITNRIPVHSPSSKKARFVICQTYSSYFEKRHAQFLAVLLPYSDRRLGLCCGRKPAPAAAVADTGRGSQSGTPGSGSTADRRDQLHSDGC